MFTVIVEWIQGLRDVLAGRAPAIVEPDATRQSERRRVLAMYRDRYRYARFAESFMHRTPSASRFSVIREAWKLDWLLGIAVPALLIAVYTGLVRFLWMMLERALSSAIIDRLKTLAYPMLIGPFWGLTSWLHIRGPSDADRTFAMERLDGPNPLLIRRIADRADAEARFTRTSLDSIERWLGAEWRSTIDAELADGRLFVVDFAPVAQALLFKFRLGRTRDSRFREKYLPSPVALFALRERTTAEGGQPRHELLPVAIQCDQKAACEAEPANEPTKENVPHVFHPGDAGWELAKHFVRVADANHQEHVSHNARHHFVAEAFAMATRRRLARNHPIHVLLQPHVAHSIFVNWIIALTLRRRGMSVETQFSGELIESRTMTSRGYVELDWERIAPDLDVAHRGVDDPRLPYPWRDDAIRWWIVIRDFVTKYVAAYYPSDAAVAGDAELKDWWTEIHGRGTGGIAGLNRGDPPATPNDLVEILARFLFLAGPSHASIHFTLQWYLPWTPALPRASYAGMPWHGDRWKLAHRRALPPPSRAAGQIQVGKLSGYQYGRFGRYWAFRLGWAADTKRAVAELRRDLRALSRQIGHDNRHRVGRLRPYRYLLPRKVPNSINL